MDFSIITPSFNMLWYLKRCHASILDQKNVLVEHIVVDNNSTDGTVEWLNENNIKCIIESDKGMYDAVNKGVKIAKGDIIAYLNCDEQYLEGTLATVKKMFESCINVDFIHGNMLTINNDGSLNAFKKSHKLKKNFILSTSLYAYSCATFFRKNIFNLEYYFRDKFKSVGDVELIIRLLENNFKSLHINEYLSVFFLTGNNLSQDNISRIERNKLKELYCFNNRYRYLYIALKIITKCINGVYNQNFPLYYSIYLKSLTSRHTIKALKGNYKSNWTV